LGRRGRKRQLAVDDEYWKLILEGPPAGYHDKHMSSE
jgi:hypothetical protein